MGADLIGIGYTRDEDHLSLDEVQDYIKSLTDEQALALVVSGDSAGFYGDADLERSDGDEYRAIIRDGADTLDYEGGRISVTYPIAGTWYFVFAGDATWGDPPFEGFDDACILLDATTAEAEKIRSMLGIIGGGIVLPEGVKP